MKTQSVTKQDFTKFQTLEYPAYQNDSLKKEINKKVLAKAEDLIDKSSSCPRNKLSSSQTLILDDVETRVFLLDFAQQLRRINADFPGIYIIWRHWYTSDSDSESECQNKKERTLVFFEVWTPETAEAVHTGWWYFWICAQISEGKQSASIKGETIFVLIILLYKTYSRQR